MISAGIVFIAVMTDLIGNIAFDPLYSRIIIWTSGLLVAAGITISTVKKGMRNKTLEKI